MDLTSTKKQFCWSSQAQTAFESHYFSDVSGLPILIVQALRRVNLMHCRRFLRLRLVPTPSVAILQPEWIVVAVTCGVVSKVRDTTVPTGGPERLLFVPESV